MGKKPNSWYLLCQDMEEFLKQDTNTWGAAGSERAKMAEQRQPVLPGVTQRELNPDRKQLLSGDWEIAVMGWNLDSTRDAAFRKMSQGKKMHQSRRRHELTISPGERGWRDKRLERLKDAVRKTEENQTDNSKVIWFSLTSGLHRLLAHEKNSVFLK